MPNESKIKSNALRPDFVIALLQKKVSPPAELGRHNANLVVGNISGGLNDITQLFLRPTAQMYSTPTKGLYLCSSSTPPGGVHGMCGYYTAQRVLKEGE